MEISKLEGAAERRAALLAGSVDIVGSSLDDLAVTVSQGVDAAAFMCADFSNGGDGILGSDAVPSLEVLAHSPVAVQPGFVNHFFLLYVLDARGISARDLQIRPMTPDDAGAAFISRAVDAAVTWEPHLTTARQKRPDTKLLVTSKEFPEAILDLFIAKQIWLRDHEATKRAFVEAWDEAVALTVSRPATAMPWIAREIGVSTPAATDMLAGAKLLGARECSALLRQKGEDLPKKVVSIWSQAGFVRPGTDLVGRLLPTEATPK